MFHSMPFVDKEDFLWSELNLWKTQMMIVYFLNFLNDIFKHFVL